MQAGKVDIPSACKICGANLNDDAAETCGRACEGSLRRRRLIQKIIGAAPGDRAIIQHEGDEIVGVLVLHQSHGYFNVEAIGSLPEIAAIRAKIVKIKIEDRCGPQCATWAVFNADSSPELEPCIECWSSTPDDDKLLLEEVEALPEAEHELALAVRQGESYGQPLISVPCVCGCEVFQLANGRDPQHQIEWCSACGEHRDHECHCAVPGNCDICKAVSLLDMCKRLAAALERAGGFAGVVDEALEMIDAHEEAMAADPFRQRMRSATELLEAHGFEISTFEQMLGRIKPRVAIFENLVVPPAPPLGRDEPLFRKVLDAMDEAEEIDGPEGDDYRRLMQAIEDEARSRRTVHDKE